MRFRDADLVVTLRRVPLFAEMSEGELETIAEKVLRTRYEAGGIVFLEGERCKELWIVESGSVKLFKSSVTGREQLIGIERTGSTLAEAPVFDGGRYSISASTIEDSVLLRLEATHFQKICFEHPEVAAKVIRVLGHRLRHLDGLIEELSFSTVRGRLIAYLLRLARAEGKLSVYGVEFVLLENNEDLAARMGTVRELISRNLGRLHGDGLIIMRKRNVSIPNLELLEKEGQARA